MQSPKQSSSLLSNLLSTSYFLLFPPLSSSRYSLSLSLCILIYGRNILLLIVFSSIWHIYRAQNRMLQSSFQILCFFRWRSRDFNWSHRFHGPTSFHKRKPRDTGWGTFKRHRRTPPCKPRRCRKTNEDGAPVHQSRWRPIRTSQSVVPVPRQVQVRDRWVFEQRWGAGGT